MVIELCGVTKDLLNGLYDILSPYRPCLCVKPFRQRLLVTMTRCRREEVLDVALGGHPKHKLEHVLLLFHHRSKSLTDVLELLIQLVPYPRLNRFRVAKAAHFNALFLPVSVKPPDSLVQSHRVPR